MKQETAIRCKILFLLAALLMVQSCGKQNHKPVSDGFLFDVDGCRIYGSFLPPVEPDKYCFILLHGLGSSHREWEYFCNCLKSRKFGYLAIDERGHGKSVYDAGGNAVDYRKFKLYDWQKLIADMRLAVKYLNRHGIRDENIIIVGASIGANISINYCAWDNRINCAVLLSPGQEYAGIKINKAIYEYGSRRLVIAASPLDPYAYMSMKMIASKLPAKKDLYVIEGEGDSHGAKLLNEKKIKELFEILGEPGT